MAADEETDALDRGDVTRARLLALLDMVLAGRGEIFPPEEKVVEQIRDFRTRLVAGRFQLAVIGQFKRGKSSLLNALLGMPVLPTGVLPLTAIPTFISYAETPALHVELEGHTKEAWSGGDLDALRARLAALVTEAGNPHNEKHVLRVEAALPSPLLADGLVVIDTPGIGSAELHNTEAARAALPECDAALVVLSPDPPITEAEIAYLAEIRAYADLIIPVLNKIDLVTASDRSASLEYLTSVLARIGITEPVFAVSSALARDGCSGSRAENGVAELAAHVRSLGKETRQRALDAAIARKAGIAVEELKFQNSVALAALTAPLDTLNGKISQILEAIRKITSEQAIVLDYLAAERIRHAKRIDEDAAVLRTQATSELLAVLDAEDKQERDSVFAQIAQHTARFFELAYQNASKVQRQRLEETAQGAMSRLEPLLDRIRQAAAQALGIEFSPVRATVSFTARSALAWVQRPAESINPFPPGLLDNLLPRALRNRRMRRAMEQEIQRLVTVNVERLRWELQQSTIEALRSFGSDSEAAFQSANASVGELIENIRTLREKSQTSADAAICARTARGVVFVEASTALSAMIPGVS